MKKWIVQILAVVLTVGCLAGCGAEKSGTEDAAETKMQAEEAAEQSEEVTETTEQTGDALQIVSTIFPEYDWVRQILGENPANAEVTLLLDQGVDLHSFQPTAEDIMKISACDLFVYVGGESDAWVEDALQEATNEDMVVIDLLEVLGDRVKEEEIVEGMEAEDEEAEYDEHVWLSLRSASLLCEELASVIAGIDPEHAGVYEANAAAYREELAALDAAYQEAVDAAKVKTLLFGDRFPFRYLTEDYGISYYAAFAGCSAETEASFETITFLAKKIDELGLTSVMTIEGSTPRIAETIIECTKEKNQKILSLDSMQAVTGEDAADGVTYLDRMKYNLDVLKEALEESGAE